MKNFSLCGIDASRFINGLTPDEFLVLFRILVLMEVKQCYEIDTHVCYFQAGGRAEYIDSIAALGRLEKKDLITCEIQDDYTRVLIRLNNPDNYVNFVFSNLYSDN
jgi:hypothetical protein